MKALSRLFLLNLCLLIAFALVFTGCLPGKSQPSAVPPTSLPVILHQETAVPTTAPTESTATPTTSPVSSGPFRMVEGLDENIAPSFDALVSTADGMIWLITKEHVIKIQDAKPVVFLEEYPGKILAVDDLERVWVSSEDGAEVSAWDGKAWTTYAADTGWTPLMESFSSVIAVGQSDLQDRTWFTTSQDVRSFDGKEWSVFTRQDLGMDKPVYDDLMARFMVKVFDSGTVWVGECDWGGPGPFGGGGVRWLEGVTWQGASSPVASGCVNAILEDHLGRIWTGVDSNLWRYDPFSGEWEEFSTPDSPIAEMRVGFIDSLAVDENNDVWPVYVLCGGASCFGNCVLYHLQEEQFTQVGEVGEYDSGYWGPLFDAAGIPWVYRMGGVYRINGELPELVSPLIGRFGTLDEEGRVWFVASYEKSDRLWVLDKEP